MFHDEVLDMYVYLFFLANASAVLTKNYISDLLSVLMK